MCQGPRSASVAEWSTTLDRKEPLFSYVSGATNETAGFDFYEKMSIYKAVTSKYKDKFLKVLIVSV